MTSFSRTFAPVLSRSPRRRLGLGLAAMAVVALAPLTALAQTIVSSGTGQLQGTFAFDFDAGVQLGTYSDGAADVFWEQQTAIIRNLVPTSSSSLGSPSSATITNLGVVDFSAITYSYLTGLSYNSSAINGNDNGTNQLVTGDVFALHTSAGNFAKVTVTTYGYNLQLQWVTYNNTPIPEPATIAAILGLAAMGAVTIRRRQLRRRSTAA